jgi:DNA-binding MarR family transcriptional regulator
MTDDQAGARADDSADDSAGGLPVGGPDYSPGFWLWHATLRWQREIAAVLAPLGLTHVQFVLLSCAWWLNGHGQVPNQLGLARQAGTDVKMTSQVLARLEARRLVVRTVDPSDTRAKLLRVTPAGAELAQQAITVVDAVDDEFFGAVADRPGLTEMLTALR